MSGWIGGEAMTGVEEVALVAGALDALERFVKQQVCEHCGGAGGFNVRDWEGWSGDVNRCWRCNATGRPALIENAQTKT